jgi:hypothetical protein
MDNLEVEEIFKRFLKATGYFVYLVQYFHSYFQVISEICFEQLFDFEILAVI